MISCMSALDVPRVCHSSEAVNKDQLLCLFLIMRMIQPAMNAGPRDAQGHMHINTVYDLLFTHAVCGG